MVLSHHVEHPIVADPADLDVGYVDQDALLGQLGSDVNQLGAELAI